MKNELSAKQLYIMIFFIPLVFKMSSLPGLMYGEANATSFLLIGAVVLTEFLQLGIVLFACSKGGMESVKQKYGAKTYCALALPMLFIVFMKLIVLVREMSAYICGFLFYNISEKLIVPIILLAVLYIGTRDVKSIGRLFELSVWFIPIIVLFGFFFGKTKVDFGYVSPIFEQNGSVYLKTIGKYLIFTFDFSPLLFFNVKPPKKKFVALCSVLSTLTVMGAFACFYGVYGNMSAYADCAFARLATFNTIISEIGGLDWPSALLWLVTSTLSLSLKVKSVSKIAEQIKIKQIGSFAFVFAVGALLVFKIKTLKEALETVTMGIQYAVFAAEIVLPILILVFLFERRKGCEES